MKKFGLFLALTFLLFSNLFAQSKELKFIFGETDNKN
jgi:hypothetical protein